MHLDEFNTLYGKVNNSSIFPFNYIYDNSNNQHILRKKQKKLFRYKKSPQTEVKENFDDFSEVVKISKDSSNSIKNKNEENILKINEIRKQIVVNGFNQRFSLDLKSIPSVQFLSPSSNYLRKHVFNKNPENKYINENRSTEIGNECFFSGIVNGDTKSHADINLCHQGRIVSLNIFLKIN